MVKFQLGEFSPQFSDEASWQTSKGGWNLDNSGGGMDSTIYSHSDFRIVN